MAKHKLTVSVSDEHFDLLQQIAKFSSRRPGDIAKDMIIQVLDGLQEMYKDYDGDNTESSMRRTLRFGLNKMMDVFQNNETE